MNEEQYVIDSLELHLFFGRIMKEHALFLEAGFTPKDAALARAADRFKTEFERLLHNAIRLSGGVVGADVLASGELVTDFTYGTEQKTQALTGIAINQNLTMLAAKLYSGANPIIGSDLIQAARSLNRGAAPLLDSFIGFKEQVLSDVRSCTVFTANYPLLIDHILREARLYRSHLAALESGRGIDEDAKSMELFWDQIMLEHALFIRGLLDPTEGDLINSANDFAAGYSDLLEKARTVNDTMLAAVTKETLEDTKRLREFKAAGTDGIARCKIRSIILPLLADHVLREANHYIRLLEQVG